MDRNTITKAFKSGLNAAIQGNIPYFTAAITPFLLLHPLLGTMFLFSRWALRCIYGS